MFFYFLQIAIFVCYSFIFLFIQHKGSRRLYLVITGVHLILLMGLRSYTVGTDTLSYESFVLGNGDAFNGNGAFLYNLISQEVVRTFNGSYAAFLVCVSFLTVSFTLASVSMLIRNNVLLVESLFLYLTFYYYFEAFNISRQMLALSMVAFAVTLLLHNKKMFSILLMFAAIGIHTTAVLGLFFYLFYYMRLTLIRLILLITILAFSRIMLPTLVGAFSSLFSHYEMYSLSTYQIEAGSGRSNVIMGIFLILIVLLTLSLTQAVFDPITNVLIVAMAVGGVWYIVGANSSLLVRMGDYYGFFSVIAIPLCLDKIASKFLHKRNASIVLTSFTMLFAVTVFYFKISQNFGGIIPYFLIG
ncbi:hypothetical protein ATW97_07285 [Oenococcus oeni]|nr:hypothetical protein ATW97_07285 [Oenococcus oeni]